MASHVCQYCYEPIFIGNLFILFKLITSVLYHYATPHSPSVSNVLYISGSLVHDVHIIYQTCTTYGSTAWEQFVRVVNLPNHELFL